MSHPHFEIGEIAIYWNPSSVNHNTEVTIAGALEPWSVRNMFTGEEEEYMGHLITPGPDAVIPGYVDRNLLVCNVLKLRKRPPREDLKTVGWDQCVWKPESVSA